MAPKKQLGISLGKRSISLVETEAQLPKTFIKIPHNLFNNQTVTAGKDSSDEDRLINDIKNFLQDNKIIAKIANLSLPSDDIIFRSFIIPPMTSHEIPGVVDFEARKYIPFRLEDLAYTYYPVKIPGDDSNRIRVLFVAIRKDIIERYVLLFARAGLQILYSEPSPMSLVRVLMIKNQIQENARIAIIQMEETGGKIIIINKRIPRFVRNFQLLVSQSQESGTDANFLSARLFNEIRISFDYYDRQHPQEGINKIIALSKIPSDDLSKSLSKEFDIPSISLKNNTIFGVDQPIDIQLVSAFGIGLKSIVAHDVNFDLLGTHLQIKPEACPINYRALAKIGVGCLLCIGLTFFFSNKTLSGYKQKSITLTKQQGVFEILSTIDIEKKTKEVNDKFIAYKNARVQTNVSSFLVRVPQLMPDGIWLKEFAIQYSEIQSQDENKPNAPSASSRPVGPPGPGPGGPQGPPGGSFEGPGPVGQSGLFGQKGESTEPNTKISIQLEGYAYAEETNQQIRMINRFLTRLKNDKDFFHLFESIDLETIQTVTLQQHTSTQFKIIFK